MELKNYQQNTLNVLKSFFESCRIIGHIEAYAKITSDPEIAQRLSALKSRYIAWDALPNTPRVCIKVPTGGGKTIIAAHAIKIVGDTWREKDYPLVLWFVPSDTIRRQTAEALKNPRHPYRQVLDEQFRGKVRIFDLDEKFNIRPSDINENTCIIVSTIQSFVKEDTAKYNVYKDNENLDAHFAKIPKERFDGMEMRNENDRPKYSFANLLYYHRPIMIVDEAHKVVTDLSQRAQGRINPAAIIEFTATPHTNNNTIYNVRAAELKEEEMIKLPIVLTEQLGWEQAVDQAIAKRAELEKLAEAEDKTDRIRPILLFQAQNKNGEVNIEILKNYLIETANLPKEAIAIVTGDQHELDGIDILNSSCPIKYIITVEALKEGWDCSFAYVLCSLANIKSDTSVAQLLGRVMRMPNARTRKIAALNKAYAFVSSAKFGEAAKALVEKLIERGFDDEEARKAIEQPALPMGGLFAENGKVELEQPLPKEFVPESIKIENDKTLVFTPETTDEDIEKICKLDSVSTHKALEIQETFKRYKQIESAPSAAKAGEIFTIPRLTFWSQGEFLLAEPHTIFAQYDWDIATFATTKLGDDEFKIEPQGNNFVISLDNNKLVYTESAHNQTSLPSIEVEGWTITNLVRWLDNKLKQIDIPQAKMVEWLRRIVAYLTETKSIGLTELTLAKFALANKLEAKIKTARLKAKEAAFQASLFSREARVELNFDTPFAFKENMYDDQRFIPYKYQFNKHYLGANKIPKIGSGESGEDGEEFECAQAIDRLPLVKYWVRNVSQHRHSYKLPTSTDWFYPDFAARLNDGRIFLIEYKGKPYETNDDSKEKIMVGELWEKKMNGMGLFIMAVKSKDGLNVTEQLRNTIDSKQAGSPAR